MHLHTTLIAGAAAWLLTACGAPQSAQKPAESSDQAEQPGLSREVVTSLATPQLEALCDHQQFAACEELGNRIRFKSPNATSLDLPTNQENASIRAAALYLQACEGGQPTACAQLAGMLQSGEGVGKNSQQAAKFYDRACTGGVELACTGLGVLLASQGQRLKEARALLERGCTANHAPACAYLATLYYEGGGGPQNIERAIELLDRACDARLGEACTMLGTVLERFIDDDVRSKQARAIFERSCNGGDALGCAGLGRLLWAGVGGQKEADRAMSLWVQACDAEVGRACWDLSNAHRERGAADAAVRAQKRACKLGVATACAAEKPQR